ncbi:FUSC family protein [Agrobacterium rosae]|uniref:Putative membrane protein n=1 Tax=Agrobacterium rosae TaxID=1972867 RepID=A0A1R3U1S1_9HYPH|nr:FUSC family protein [Agrobacterium rosae]SCX35019.1 putative membrane protein [Agrobacterium rosae]
MLQGLLDRARAAFTHVLAAALAAAFSFWVARHLLGHPQPIFAAITALICLAPNIPNHFTQGINLLIGVTTGLIVGEVALMFPYEMGELRMAVAIFIAMIIAASLNKAPMVAIQAGASAMLVLLLGPQSAGFVRLLDVLVGVATGISIAFVFFRKKPDA